jgi:hypothetical protein
MLLQLLGENCTHSRFYLRAEFAIWSFVLVFLPHQIDDHEPRIRLLFIDDCDVSRVLRPSSVISRTHSLAMQLTISFRLDLQSGRRESQ